MLSLEASMRRKFMRRRKFDDAAAIGYDRNAGWSSLVARWAHNPKVGGSNPPPATKGIISLREFGLNRETPKNPQYEKTQLIREPQRRLLFHLSAPRLSA